MLKLHTLVWSIKVALHGNNYQIGYNFTKFIDNLEFDYIILHEAGHEWWGNSITTNDIADMWVHEGFCTYSRLFSLNVTMVMKKPCIVFKKSKKNLLLMTSLSFQIMESISREVETCIATALMSYTLRSLVDNDSSF